MSKNEIKGFATRGELHWPRRIFHVVSGVSIVAASLLFKDIQNFIFIGLILTLIELGFELLRFRFGAFNQWFIGRFRALMRDRELKGISGIPYYCFGCLIAFIVFPREVAMLAVLYLAIGDPTASLAGVWLSRGGEARIAIGSKSLQGSLACFFVCAVVTLLMSPYVLEPVDRSPVNMLITSLVGGLAAALAEALPLRADDNLSIPIISGSLIWFYLSFTGLIPGVLN